jgi:hypothetical protein
MTETPSPQHEQDTARWNEGFAAGRAGKKNCPYRPGSPEAWAWSSGQIEGDAKRQAGFTPPRLVRE